MMNDTFLCTIGHSQGVVAAVAFASSSSRLEYMHNCIKALTLLYLLGFHSEKIVERQQEIPEHGPSSMLLVKGIGRPEIVKHVTSFNSVAPSNLDTVHIGVINTDDAFVISGYPSSLSDFKARVSTEVKDSQFLSVSVPFHSPHLRDAIGPIQKDASSLSLTFPRDGLHLPVFSCKDGSDLRFHGEEDLLPLLLRLVLCEPLDWPKAMSVASNDFVFKVYDFTPGSRSLPLACAPRKQTSRAPIRQGEEEVFLLKKLRSTASQILSVPEVGIVDDVPLQSLGFDSISVTHFSEKLSRELGFTVTVGLIFGAGSLEDLASHLLQLGSGIYSCFLYSFSFRSISLSRGYRSFCMGNERRRNSHHFIRNEASRRRF